MKDAQGNELKVGDRVAFKAPKGIGIGTIAKFRIAHRYGRQKEAIKVVLENPELRYERGSYQRTADGMQYAKDENDRYIWVQGAPRKPLLEREVWNETDIILCPKVVKEDLTKD